MFTSLRSRISGLIAATAGFFGLASLMDSLPESLPAPINPGVVAPPTGAGAYVSRPYKSSRVPHSNRDARRRAGIPHGTPGAKLARKAAAGKLGLTK